MLTEIDEKSFDVVLNIVYATENNFTNKQIYKQAACFLHEDAAEKLKIAHDVAEKIGYTLKIYDAFRPIPAQHILRDALPGENYCF